ncbi:putative FCPy domain-containing protein [Ananas comosus]|uniref:Putative FCPy domain-containing protein n=1 Tax=Ananas comosus TaxID=4615 RepID=A0A199V1K4_ANACO|nr:putative FCPy domain-containing protein [Ananas comosus]
MPKRKTLASVVRPVQGKRRRKRKKSKVSGDDKEFGVMQNKDRKTEIDEFSPSNLKEVMLVSETVKEASASEVSMPLIEKATNSAAAGNQSLPNLEDMEALNKNSKSSDSNNRNPLVGEKEVDVKGVNTNSASKGVTLTYKKRNNRATGKWKQKTSSHVSENNRGTEKGKQRTPSYVSENVDSSPTLEAANADLVCKRNNEEASMSGNLILSTNKENSSTTADDEKVEITKSELDAPKNSHEVKSTNSRQVKKYRRRRRKSKSSNSEASVLNESKSALERETSNLISTAEIGQNNISGCERKKNKGKKKVFDKNSSEVDQNASSAAILSSLEDVKVTDKRSNVDVSINDNMVSNCETSEGFSNSAEENTKIDTIDRKEGASLPPSPIRGVIDSSSSLCVPVNKNNNLASNEESVNFSFQIGGDILTNDLTVKDAVETCKSRSRDSSQICACIQDNTNESEKGIDLSPTNLAHKNSTSADEIEDQDKKLKAISLSPKESILSHQKKLLVLDLNGLLADINQDYRNAHKADRKVNGKFVFKRPFCDEFLDFCFRNFKIGVWSSRKMYNVNYIVDFLMGNLKDKLLFCWDQSKCTLTGYRTIENVHKPLVLKELKKLWNKDEPDLPWEKGEYSESNTLLVDDSPYKALCNPPHTAIFPHPYYFSDRNDNSLGQGGDLRVYLEKLAVCDDVRCFVRENPFGQPAISDSDPSWKFYLQVIDKMENISASAL